MQVKRRLQLSSALSLIAIIAVLLVIVASMYRVIRDVEALKIVGQITTASFERLTLRNDYVQSGKERAKAQWLNKHEQIGRHLLSAAEKFRDPADQKIVAEMIADQESIGRIFSAIVKKREKGKDAIRNDALLMETEERLITQLNKRIYELVSQVQSLQESHREALFSTLRLAGWGIACVLILVMAAVILNSWTMGRSVTERIHRLRDGAVTVGGGNLDHRIDLEGKDELVELSRAFNSMTARLQGSYRDLAQEIEERKHAEEAFRMSEMRLRLFIEHAPAALAMFDREMRYLSLSQRWQRVFDIGESDLIGASHYEIVPDIPPEWKDSHRRGLAGEVLTFEEERWQRADGSVLWLHREIRPWYDTADIVGGIVIFAEDITNRKQVEEELRKFEEDLERAQAIGQLGSWRLDTRRNILTWSDENHRIFGLPKETPMSYETFLSTIHPDDRQYVDTQWQAGLRGAPYDIEHRIVVAGQVKWVREKAYLEFDAAGQLLGGFGITQDITTRKQVEEDLKERTLQLEDANKELESFSYSVSHDLRTPLRAIHGYIRMILKKHADNFDGDARAMFEVIQNNAQKMGQLIDELLAFSRLSRTPLSITTLDIEELIREVWEELIVLIPDRHLTLKIAKTPPCRGDRGLIKQVLVNLLSNAIKFTRKREEAFIETGCNNSNSKTICYIRDNGAGFDMNYYSKLFGVFQRLHSAGDFEGTGVGLAIVQRIINRHGGKVWAEGKVDEGATFFFTLPLQPE